MITRVHAKNFFSLADVDVSLGRLTALVGRNGAGKSNFVDVLRFVQEALGNGLDSAVAARGGLASLRRWTGRGRPYNVEIGISFEHDNLRGVYELVLAGGKQQDFRVKREYASVTRSPAPRTENDYDRHDEFDIHEGKWITRPRILSQQAEDEPDDWLRRMGRQINSTSLFLPTMRAFMQSPLTDILRSLVSHNFLCVYPNTLREPQRFSSTSLMGDHGENFAASLKKIKSRYDANTKGPFADLLAVLHEIVGDVDDIRVNQVTNYLVTELHHEAASTTEQGYDGPWFDLSRESDGTVRVLGLLIGLYQASPNRGLVAVEEPEMNVHPGALGVLVDVLREAAKRRQVLITTQSPDMISRFRADELLVAERSLGKTKIGPIAEAQRQVIEQQLFSAGDLLRIEGLHSEEAEALHMPKIVPIVEGDGEVNAVPILIGKILAELGRHEIGVARTRNSKGCSNLQKPGGLESFVKLAALEQDCGAILILMDADKACPVELAYDFTERVNRMGTKHSVVVAIAKCEYEAWFLASLETIAGRTLDGRPGLPSGLAYPKDVEMLVGVKGWLDRQFTGSRTYKETLDQAIMTRYLSVSSAAARSRSFCRLQSAIKEVIDAIDGNQVIVSPSKITSEIH